MQNKLVEGIWLCFFLLLFISFFLLHCFLGCTGKRKDKYNGSEKQFEKERKASGYSQISHLSSCPQTSNPRCEASCVCIPPGTCLKLCACKAKQTFQTSDMDVDPLRWDWRFLASLSPWYVVQRRHPKASDHSSSSLLGQQFVPHHLLGFKRVLCLNQSRYKKT